MKKIIKKELLQKEIHLFDLPLNELHIELKDDYRNKVFITCLEKYKTWRNFARILKENIRNVIRWKNGTRNPPINVLFKIVNLGISTQEDMENNIYKIKKCGGFIKNPKFPIIINGDLAQIIAAVFCDGGITKDYGVHYTNKDIKLISSFKESIQKVFGDVDLISEYIRKEVQIYQILYSGVLGIILNKIFEVPKRSKITMDTPIPSTIMNGNKAVLKSFIKRCFDDEGWVNNSIGLGRSIMSEKLKSREGPIFLQDLKYLLENKFKIKTYGPRLTRRRNYMTRDRNIQIEDYELKIYDRKSLELFYKKIGFDSESKKQKLREKLNSYKVWNTRKGDSLNFFLRKATNFILEEGKPFSAYDLSCLTKRNLARATWAITKLKKENLIILVDYKRDRINRKTVPLYTLDNRGLSLIFSVESFN